MNKTLVSKLHIETEPGLGDTTIYNIFDGEKRLDFVGDALQAEFIVDFINRECGGEWNQKTKWDAAAAWETHSPIRVYFVQHTVKDAAGNYIVCIAAEGETGYYKTDWEWGKDWEWANKIADDMNEKMGYGKRVAMIVQLRSLNLGGRK